MAWAGSRQLRDLDDAPGHGTCIEHEPNQLYWTKHTYDALGHLLTVTQNAQATSGQQTRTFVRLAQTDDLGE